MENLNVSHETPAEYRAYGKFSGHHQHGRYRQLRFDIYGGVNLERTPADCHLDIDMSWESDTGRGVSRSTSVKLDLSEMMKLHAMLGEAIQRAQRLQKEAA